MGEGGCQKMEEEEEGRMGLPEGKAAEDCSLGSSRKLDDPHLENAMSPEGLSFPIFPAGQIIPKPHFPLSCENEEA